MYVPRCTSPGLIKNIHIYLADRQPRETEKSVGSREVEQGSYASYGWYTVYCSNLMFMTVKMVI